MNYGPLIFLGIFATFAFSWFGMIVSPQLQLGKEQPTNAVASSVVYPASRPGLAAQGREVYRANGCQYCHTQVVRHNGYHPLTSHAPKEYGADFDRGWGIRNSVSKDYLFDQPVLLGSMRVGPDLKNVGERQTNQVWHFLHLYDPQLTSKGSTMPPYRFLFTKSRLKPGQQRSPEALALPESPDLAGYEVVPTMEAHALVAYLLSLQSDAQLFEAPWEPQPPKSTNEAPANAGPATNSPAK